MGQQNDAGRLISSKSNERERGGDWRSETLAQVRAIIMQALPAPHKPIEEVKWRKPTNAMEGVPVWSNADGGGIICTGETYRNVVKLTFAKGASLPDPSGLFNSSLEGNTRRAIDFHEGDKIDVKALKALIRAGAALNAAEASDRNGEATARPTITARSQRKRRRV